MNNREFKFWLRSLTPEQKLDALLWGQRTIMDAQELDFEMELQQMADFTRLNAKVSGIKDIATSIRTMFDGVLVQRDAYKAELDTLKAADQVDQDAVDAAEAGLADAQSTLDALAAVAAGTPVVLPSAGGAEDSATVG